MQRRRIRATGRRRVDRATGGMGLGLGLLLLASAVGAGPVYFLAPQTGAKVAAYRVDLPIARGKRQAFDIPLQCAEALDHAGRNADQWGSQVERNLWWKVENDCNYNLMVHRHERPPEHDLVSGYDFLNADLQDLPLGLDCTSKGCRVVDDGLSPILPWVGEGAAPRAMDRASCRIENGSFRGQVARQGEGIVCARDSRGPGLRILSVDFSDVNGDGYQDALLRLAPLGPRMGRTLMVLALTRREGEVRFTIPEHLHD